MIEVKNNIKFPINFSSRILTGKRTSKFFFWKKKVNSQNHKNYIFAFLMKIKFEGVR
jgi:hypothetical protein